MFKKWITNVLYWLIELIEKIQYRNLDLDEGDITKKIIEVYDVSNIQVKSDVGWVDVSEFNVTQPYTHYKIELDNGYSLTCADNHILFRDSYEEVFTHDLQVGDLIKTDMGDISVKTITKLNRKTSMVDLSIDHPSHRYYTSGILSHNTINSAIFILHYMMFNNTKNVLIAANVRDTAVEVLGKIKEIYTYLPFFLKQGIDVWNEGQIKFENKCRAKAFAMTKKASIGQSGDLVYVDEFAHIQPTIASQFYKSILPTMANIKNSKMIITSTPDGINLFHDILINSERDETDPLKNNFGSLRVYWHQVSGRNVSYIRINPFLLQKFNLDENDILEQCMERFNPHNKVDINNIPIVSLEKDPNNGFPVINILNVNKNKYEDVIRMKFVDTDGELIPVNLFATTSTWKLDQIKDLGSEEFFNQEYDLRFVTGSKSVLSEETIERLGKYKKAFKHIDHDVFKKIKWDYTNLKFHEDIFSEEQRKKIRGLISIDVSEGLGLDYSVINMFKIAYKPIELIAEQIENYTSMYDFFQLKQFGIFRSNIVDVEQLAEIAYVLMFEYFDEDKFKTVLEINNPGLAFSKSIKHVFEGDNNYAGHVFMKFKHRMDAKDKSLGLKVGKNKNLFVKDYQTSLEDRSVEIYDPITIQEIGTFVKHKTSAGNVQYKGDGSSHDDTVMTVVNMTQGAKESSFRELVEEFHEENKNVEIDKLIKKVIYGEGADGTDYDTFFKVVKKETFRA